MANPTRARIAEIDEELLLLEPDMFDEAIIGLAERADGMMAVAYDRTRCIDILARSMSREDAEEFFEFNTAGAWMGEATPVFIDTRVAE
jgi:hypothetical protein